MAAVGSGITGVSNPNLSGGTLAPGVSTYYEKVFLARSVYPLVLKEGGQTRTHSSNEGRTINFTRMNPFTVITSPLGELSNPVTCAINLSTVAVTLSEYGLTTITSKLGSLVSIDSKMKEAVEAMADNRDQTLNALVGAALQQGTSYYGNDHAVDTLASGDGLDACDCRLMVKTLELNNAMRYPDGFFLGKCDPYEKSNLIGDTTWVSAKTYSDVKKLYKGEMGELYGIRWLLSPLVISGTEATSTASSAVVRFYSFVHGKEAFGTYDLEGDKPKLYIIANAVDSNSPVGRVSYVSWAGSYAAKILNSSWIIAARNTVS